MDPKELSNKKIGYAPLSLSLKEPGDRRRFCSYAKERNFEFEIADPTRAYDVVYLTYNCDIPKWISYKEKNPQTKLIFELVDSYLFEQDSWKSRMRGFGKYITGSSSKLYVDYKQAIIEICKKADAVVCSTAEQQQVFKDWNDNVHISLDIFADDIKSIKTDFKTGDTLKLVWEGQPYTIDNILSIAPILNQLKDKVELHLVTDLHYYKYAKKYFKRNTEEILSDIKCKKVFHEWTPENLSKVVRESDLAIIPIDLDNKLASGKPENKLILLWQSAIPVITSATPAYIKTMKAAGIDFYCKTLEDWMHKIEWYQSLSEEQKKAESRKAYQFAQQAYSKEALVAKWDFLFDSLN